MRSILPPRYSLPAIRSAVSAMALSAILLGGCAKTDERTTASGTSDSAAPATDHSKMAGTNRPPAKDGDHEFLRMMSDHHEGLIQMATAAMTSASAPAAQADAHKLHTKQAAEQKNMIGMAQARYSERVTPMIMPSSRTMNEALKSKTGPEYDRTFYLTVVEHHREGIRMIDDMMPKLSTPDVKQMAETMKSDQQKEIAEFEKKAK